MRFHRSSEPSSADHSARILKNVGVSRLEFAATYLIEKSLARSAAIMAPFAAATAPRTAYAVVRALSTNRGLPRRTPHTEAISPYAARASARAMQKVPRRATSYPPLTFAACGVCPGAGGRYTPLCFT